MHRYRGELLTWVRDRVPLPLRYPIHCSHLWSLNYAQATVSRTGGLLVRWWYGGRGRRVPTDRSPRRGQHVVASD